MGKIAEAYVEITGRDAPYLRTLDSVKQNTDRAVSDVQKKLDRIPQHFEKVGQRMAMAGRAMTLAITMPLIGAAGYATKLAMDAVESENLFEVSMGGMAKAAREFSNEFAKSVGLNAYGVRRMLGTFNVMLTSMGLTSDQAFEMSRNFTKLAYDMASFYNLPIAQAFEKLQAGISGEIEPLKRLGIVITEDMVKQKAMQMGMQAMGDTLSQTQKTYVRYLLIMEKTSKAQGDLARTADSPANKLRRLRERVDELLITLGQKFMPIVERIVDHLNKLADWWGKLTDKQQENILKWHAAVAAAGPLLTIFGNAAKAVKILYNAYKWLTAAKIADTLATIANNAANAVGGVGAAGRGAGLLGAWTGARGGRAAITAEEIALARSSGRLGGGALAGGGAAATGLVARGIGRAIPYVGLALLTYEAAKYIDNKLLDYKERNLRNKSDGVTDEQFRAYQERARAKRSDQKEASRLATEAASFANLMGGSSSTSSAEDAKRAAGVDLDIQGMGANKVQRAAIEMTKAMNEAMARKAGPQEMEKLSLYHEKAIAQAEAEMAKEATEAKIKTFREEFHARQQYAADYLRFIGRTFDAERQEARNTYEQEITDLQLLARTGEDTRNRMWLAHAKYANAVKDINQSQVDDERRKADEKKRAAEEEKRRLSDISQAQADEKKQQDDEAAERRQGIVKQGIDEMNQRRRAAHEALEAEMRERATVHQLSLRDVWDRSLEKTLKAWFSMPKYKDDFANTERDRRELFDILRELKIANEKQDAVIKNIAKTLSW